MCYGKRVRKRALHRALPPLHHPAADGAHSIPETRWSTCWASHTCINLTLILTSDEEVSPEAINYRVSTTRNTQYSDLNTSIEYSSQIAIRVSCTRRNTSIDYFFFWNRDAGIPTGGFLRGVAPPDVSPTTFILTRRYCGRCSRAARASRS
eukprot:4334871-Pyramimonas_sp.AAC.1